MGRPKLNPFILNPEKSTSAIELKKVTKQEFVDQIEDYAKKVFTEQEYKIWKKSEEMSARFYNEGYKMTNTDNMLIMEGIKTKNKKFTIPVRKTIQSYLDVHKIKCIL